MAKREVFEGSIRNLSGIGNKILVDVFASSKRPLRFKELPYRVQAAPARRKQARYADSMGISGAARRQDVRPVHSRALSSFQPCGLQRRRPSPRRIEVLLDRDAAKIRVRAGLATLLAAISNFFLNNWLTYRDRRLRGWRVLTGLISFLLVCSIGAVVNVAFADRVFQLTTIWWFAGIAGAAVSAILNYSATALFTWRKR